jgi:Flp pilus assembly protein TadD
MAALAADLDACRALIERGELDRGIAALQRLAAAAPQAAEAWLALGEALGQAARHEEAIAALDKAAALAPEIAAPQRALGAAYRAAGRATEALAAELAATALDARSPLALYNLATAYFMAGRNEPAETWYRAALRIDPDLVAAHQNLAAILETAGRADEAQRHRDAAFSRQNLFVEAAPAAARAVLILSASGPGNVPVEFLFPRGTTTRITWVIDYAGDGQSDKLPPFDLVFNAVGDPDMARSPPAEIARFLARCDKPILNPPAGVARTRRDLLPDLLAGIDGTVVPPVARLAREDMQPSARAAAIDAAGLRLPLLLRPIGSHGGKGVVLAATPDELRDADPGAADAFYVTAYRDYRSADGHYRKYRVIFVDRTPLPYHLAISPHWLVHYFTADMLAAPWKREEERLFLEDPALTLGTKAMAALGAIGARLDLDFCGIDFSLLSDGRILVFEANATMLAHLADSPEQFPYKHLHVPKIFAAFDAMVARRLAMRDG